MSDARSVGQWSSIDLGLVSRCAHGESSAQRELFHREKRRVHAVLYRLMGSNRDMEDLVQESFLEIFKSLPRFRGECSLATWIDRITARVAYGYFAKRKTPTVHLEAVPERASRDPAADVRASSREATRRVFRALEGLEPKLRMAFSLHVIEGKPLRVVASIMQASLMATKTRVWRARRKLEQLARQDPLLSGYLRSEVRSEDE